MAAAVALFATPALTPAAAQPRYGGALPPGDYQRQCTNLYMEGQFLHGTCRGARGGGDSSINVQSCSTGIFVDENGGLACDGPGGGAPPQVRDAPPGYSTVPPRNGPAYGGYDRGGYDRGGYRGRGRGGRDTAVLYDRRSYGGGSVQVAGPTPDLGPSGINDKVRSIRLDRRSGPWLVCSDAGYRGRCVTIRESVADTRRLGMRDISSLRPE